MDVNAASSEIFSKVSPFFYVSSQYAVTKNTDNACDDAQQFSSVDLHTSKTNSSEFSHNRLKAKHAYLAGRQRKASEDQENSDDVFGKNGQELTPKEQEKVEKLKKRDAEVRAHERAHQSTGGQYAGSPSYDYEKGPDGNDYAIGGHVNIDMQEEDSPEKTLRKMEQIVSAAKAPADPSAQDLKVAAQAQQKAAQARTEMALKGSNNSDTTDQKN